MLGELLLLLLFAVLSHSWPCSPEKSSSRLTLTTYYNLLLCIMTILLQPIYQSAAPPHLCVPCALFFCASCSELLAAFQNLDCRAHSLSSERLVCTERRSMGNTTVPETRGNNACAVVVVILKALSPQKSSNLHRAASRKMPPEIAIYRIFSTWYILFPCTWYKVQGVWSSARLVPMQFSGRKA